MEQRICISDEAKKFYIPTYDELRKQVLKIYVEPTKVPKSVYKQGKERVSIMRYVIKCERVFSFLAEQLGRVSRLPRTSDMPQFYSEIVKLGVGDVYDNTLAKCSRAVRILVKLWRDYRLKILAAGEKSEAKRLAQEFVGRALSTARRALREAKLAREAIKLLRESPCIDESIPIIIVAGMPQVGKSTLVSRVSSAKPEVSPFPFTTKKVILGHGTLDNIYYQIIDTPGILDRPFDEMNQIERKAVAVIKSLRAPIIFLIDPTRDSYYSLDSQIRVLRDVMSIRSIEMIIPTLNKIDKASTDDIVRAERMVRDLGFANIYRISALRGDNVDVLLRKALDLALNLKA